MAFPHKSGFSTQSDATFTGLPPLQAGVRALTPITTAAGAQVFDTSGLVNNANAIATRRLQAQALRAEKEKVDLNTILSSVNEYGKAGIERYQPQFDAGRNQLYDFTKSNYKAIIDPSLDNGAAQKQYQQMGQSLKNLALQDKNETAVIKQYGQDIAQNPDKYTPNTRAQVAALLTDREGKISLDSFRPEQTIKKEDLKFENPAPVQITNFGPAYNESGRLDPSKTTYTSFYDPIEVAQHEQKIRDNLENKGTHLYKDFIQQAEQNGIDRTDERGLEKFKNIYINEQIGTYKAPKRQEVKNNPTYFQGLNYEQRERFHRDLEASREGKSKQEWTVTGASNVIQSNEKGEPYTSTTPNVFNSGKDISRTIDARLANAISNEDGKKVFIKTGDTYKFNSGQVVFLDENANKFGQKDYKPNYKPFAVGSTTDLGGNKRAARIPFDMVQDDFKALKLDPAKVYQHAKQLNGEADNSSETTHKVSKLGFKIRK